MTKELLDRYLKEAYRMGQVFWQQADSEFVSQHKKADVTKAKFDQLLIDAGEALAQQEHLPDSEYARGFADGQKEFAEIAGGEWQTAVVDQLVIHHVYQASHDTDPRKAVNDLLCVSNDIALDPLVSSDAQALIDRGRRDAQQEQPASVDAYVGAREDAAIWKKRALEAEELNRKFIADVNGSTYLGEPVKQEQPAQEPVVVQKRVCYESGDYSAWVEIPMSEADNQYRDCVEIRKLYAHPAPTQPALSDDEILNCFYASKSEGMAAYMLAVGRAIEAHCRGGQA